MGLTNCRLRVGGGGGSRIAVLTAVTWRGVRVGHQVPLVCQVLAPWPGPTPRPPATARTPSPTSSTDTRSARR